MNIVKCWVQYKLNISQEWNNVRSISKSKVQVHSFTSDCTDISSLNKKTRCNCFSTDRIKLCAIEAGGFSIVARSYDDARSKAVPPKFYLDKVEETVTIKTEYKKLRNKALAELQKLFDKNSTKLFYIAKAVDTASVQYKKTTPNDIIYDMMDRHINGEGTEGNKERAAKGFLDAAALDMESLKIKAIVKDSIFFKYIINKADGHIYHAASGSLLGRNVSDVIEFLKNPMNEDILKDLNGKIEKLWTM